MGPFGKVVTILDYKFSYFRTYDEVEPYPAGARNYPHEKLDFRLGYSHPRLGANCGSDRRISPDVVYEATGRLSKEFS